MDINRHAARAVPEDMAAWHRYGRVLAPFGIQPDLWKGDDRSEDSRHYIDVERYKGIGVTNLPAERARLADSAARRFQPADGILPWAIADLMPRLTAAMATNDWDEAARLAGALGHYVGDLHQPLHTTENFDGAVTAAMGVHMRWEEKMPSAEWRSSMLDPSPVAYVSNLWPAVLGWIEESHAHYPAILEADREAVRASGGNVESAAYIDKLWEKTGDMFTSQVGLSAGRLASLWYTAWVDAGRPRIPPPTDELATASVWRTKRAGVKAPAWPFLVVFGAVALWILVLSLRRGAVR